MTTTKEFFINQFLSLRLEHDQTMIYVGGKLSIQCKFLLLDIPVAEIGSLNDISSIDDASDVLDHSLEKEPYKFEIPPEVEFWGHCSNMQVWYENDYDTRLLDRWLAFPLLKELTEAGDPVAKKVFKEEIAKRYVSGHPSVVGFLNYEGYLNYLSSDEIGEIIDELKSKEENIEYVTYKRRICIFVLNNRLNLRNCGIEDISNIEGLNSLKNLKELDLSYNQISEIKGLENLVSLEFLGLINNRISEIKGLEKLKNLRTLFLHDNQITEIKGLGTLQNLESLALENNKITEIKGLENLNKLKVLGLELNPIPKQIIEELSRLDSSEGVKLVQNFVEYCRKNLK